MAIHSQPKFPRKRNKRSYQLFIIVIFLFVIFASLNVLFFRKDTSQETVLAEKKIEEKVSKNTSNPLPVVQVAKNDKPLLVENDKKKTLIETVAFSKKKNVSTNKKQTQSIASEPIVYTLNASGQSFSYDVKDNLWHQPFVGFGLDEIASLLSKKYGKLRPVEWGERLPGVVWSFFDYPKEPDSLPVLALTLDACAGEKGKSYDEELITYLRQNKIPATIFVTNKWISNNRQIFMALAKDPLFEIAAHGKNHAPCSVNGKSAYGIKGTGSMLELVHEIEGNVRTIQRLTSNRPRWFRSGTAFYDEVAIRVLHALDIKVAGYTVALDEGATLPAKEVEKRLLAAKHGSILLAHLNHPKSGTGEGIISALSQLNGTRKFVRMSQIDFF